MLTPSSLKKCLSIISKEDKKNPNCQMDMHPGVWPEFSGATESSEKPGVKEFIPKTQPGLIGSNTSIYK